jgi:hypothetical protein
MHFSFSEERTRPTHALPSEGSEQKQTSALLPDLPMAGWLAPFSMTETPLSHRILPNLMLIEIRGKQNAQQMPNTRVIPHPFPFLLRSFLIKIHSIKAPRKEK